MSYGEIMFFKRVNEKSRMIEAGRYSVLNKYRELLV